MDTNELISKTPIEFYQHMDVDEFQQRFSGKIIPPNHFSDRIGFFTTNEYDYPDSLPKIKVRGGIHLAVMGGVDPVLGQISVMNPDLTIMTDINQSSIDVTTKGRIWTIKDSVNASKYWERVLEFFKSTVRKIDPKRWDFPLDQDSTRHGWSSPQHFSTVKQAVESGKVKWIAGDVMEDGLTLGLQISQATGVPIRLIYVSNIFDYFENDRRKKIF